MGYCRVMSAQVELPAALADWRLRATLTVQEAGEVVGVSRATAYEAVAAGQWPVIVVGRRKRVLTAGLRRLLGESVGP